MIFLGVRDGVCERSWHLRLDDATLPQVVLDVAATGMSQDTVFLWAK